MLVATSDDQMAWFVQMLAWALSGEGDKMRASLNQWRRAWA